MKKSVIIPLFVLGLLLSGSSSTYARPYAVFAGFVSAPGPCKFYFVVIWDDMNTPNPTDDVRLASGWISSCPGGTPDGNNGMIQDDNETDELFPNLSGFNEPDSDIEEFAVSSESMILYPNPTTQELNVSLQSANPISGFIASNVGLIIKNFRFEDNLNVIDISDMSSGNYVLRVLGDDDKIYVEQFVVH